MTRWLSLGKCLSRLLEQWHPLLIYFKEESKKVQVSNNCLPSSLSSYKIPKIKKENSLAASSVTSQAAPSTSNSSPRKRKKSLPKEIPKTKCKSASVLIKNVSVISSSKAIVATKKSKYNSNKKILSQKKDGKKRILQREERIFFSLSNDLYYNLACRPR